MSAILQIKNIRKTYGDKGYEFVALKNINLKINEKEFVAIMGPSGSGKTTLLNCISTIDKVSSGDIYIDGMDLNTMSKKELAKFRREKLGFIFQDFNLIDTLDVYGNIALAMTINNADKKCIDNKVKDIAEKLKIENILNKYPYQISGGQKQRCACARAIVNNPKLVLADEPTGALDSKNSEELLELLQYMNRELNVTIVMVTHDAMVAGYSDKVLFLKDGEIANEIVKSDADNDDFYNKIFSYIRSK